MKHANRRELTDRQWLLRRNKRLNEQVKGKHQITFRDKAGAVMDIFQTEASGMSVDLGRTLMDFMARAEQSGWAVTFEKLEG